MGEWQLRAAEAMREQQDSYIRQVASPSSPADQIAQAKALLDAQAITPEEYERFKDKALT